MDRRRTLIYDGDGNRVGKTGGAGAISAGGLYTAFMPTVTNPLLPAQTATVNLTVQNLGGCTAVQSAVKVTNPDGTVSTLPGFTVGAGQTTTVSSKWVVPAIAPHASGETDAQYRARMTAVDQATLPFTVALSWSDPAGSLYGPESRPVQATENVPIVAATMTGPATAQAGNSITYAVSLSNVGHAAAGAVSLSVTLPDGSKQTPAVGALAAGGSYSANVAFTIPTGQPAGQITATSAANWTDTVLNGYGPLSASAVTTVSNPGPVNSLVLTPQVAGPDPVGSAQAFSVVLKDPSGNPIAGATVTYTVTGANPGAGTAVTDSTGTAQFSYTGAAKGTDSVVVTMGPSASNTAMLSWVTPVQSISTTTVVRSVLYQSRRRRSVYDGAGEHAGVYAGVSDDQLQSAGGDGAGDARGHQHIDEAVHGRDDGSEWEFYGCDPSAGERVSDGISSAGFLPGGVFWILHRGQRGGCGVPVVRG